MNMRETILKNKILIIMRNVDTNKCLDYVEAVLKGGISFIEIAMNTPDAAIQIKMIKDKFGDKVTLGAGTAVTTKIIDEAMNAGAQFVLTPSTSEDILDYCKKKSIPFLPGVLTPLDVMMCQRYGFDTFKLFPAGDMPKTYVKSLKGPFDNTCYVAVGGVNINNVEEFIESGYIGVGIGSSVVPRELINEGRWKEVTEYIKRLVEASE